MVRKTNKMTHSDDSNLESDEEINKDESNNKKEQSTKIQTNKAAKIKKILGKTTEEGTQCKR